VRVVEDEATLGGGEIGGLGPSPLGVRRAGLRHDKKSAGARGMAMRRNRASSSKDNEEGMPMRRSGVFSSKDNEEVEEGLWSVWAERKSWSCGKVRSAITIYSSSAPAHGSYTFRASYLDLIALSKADDMGTTVSSLLVQSIQSPPRFIIFTSSSCC
jgi:hypothetical protein